MLRFRIFARDLEREIHEEDPLGFPTCVCACVRASERVCVCVRACLRACVRTHAVITSFFSFFAYFLERERERENERLSISSRKGMKERRRFSLQSKINSRTLWWKKKNTILGFSQIFFFTFVRRILAEKNDAARLHSPPHVVSESLNDFKKKFKRERGGGGGEVRRTMFY